MSSALDLVDALYRLNRMLAEHVRAHVAEVANLDVADFMVLQAAKREVSPSELAQRLSTHPAATSRTISSLVRAGLVRRMSDLDDGRRFLVSLTAEGRRVTDLIAARIEPDLQAQLDRLGSTRSAELLAALSALLEA
jgi:DNA-binding MarR family transcriptional regulator